jgi:ribosomal protein L3 glutamine methyltransferase
LDLVNSAAQRLAAADVCLGHGIDNAEDEALFLVLHAIGLSYDSPDAALSAELTLVQLNAVDLLISERIESRKPSAYLVGYTWFCGYKFRTDERVLVPRSPIAELIVKRFQPWWPETKKPSALEIGTGGGCIAISMALNLENLDVEATDISVDAIKVARENARLHSVGSRVRFYLADLFPEQKRKYDLIISNPPYVPLTLYNDLPAEYHCEPAGALVSGEDGMDCVRRILEQASDYLTDGGLLFMEVGELWEVVDKTFPTIDFTWIDLEFGGEGVLLVSREQLL